jgi:hypothetical protein
MSGIYSDCGIDNADEMIREDRPCVDEMQSLSRIQMRDCIAPSHLPPSTPHPL